MNISCDIASNLLDMHLADREDEVKGKELPKSVPMAKSSPQSAAMPLPR